MLNDPVRLRRREMELSFKGTMVVAGIVACWVLVGDHAIRLLFGSQYPASFQPSVVLMCALIPETISAPFSRAMVILNKVKLNFAMALLRLVLNAALCFVFVPRSGALGAAIALGLAQLIASATTVVLTNAAIQERIVMAKAGGRDLGE